MGVFDLDIVNDVLWWAPQTYDVFGVSPETFTPTRESVVDLVHPDDRKGFIQGRLQALAAPQPFVHEYRCAAARRPHRLDQPPRPGRVRRQRPPVRSFGVSLDITERKLAEQALQRGRPAEGQFLATLAHELRNPLAPIRNAVAAAAQRRPRRPAGRRCRDVIDRQVTQMARLLDDLLDVSRITRGKFALRREPLPCRRVVEQALETAGR